MSRPRLYCPHIGPGDVDLPPEEAHHARSALRMQAGDEVLLFDGAGTQAAARLTTVTRQQVRAAVDRVWRAPFDRTVRLTLGVALPRAHRQHFLFEKCTELGVAAIWPLVCERSVARPRPGSVGKWSRTAIEAAKQSGRAWVPQIEPPQAFAGAVARGRDFDLAVVLDVREAAPTFVELLARHRRCCTMAAWVGPEGGLTPAEVEAAVAAGAKVARLGPAVLRVETAAVAVASIVGAWTDASAPDDAPG